MGIDFTATLGYGMKLTNQKLIDKICEEEIKVEGKDFVIEFCGDEYSDEGITTYLFIKNSTMSVSSYDNNKSPIKPEKLIASAEWDVKLNEWCDNLLQKKPKIGWWLCGSVS
jgi:hypothetical protein